MSRFSGSSRRGGRRRDHGDLVEVEEAGAERSGQAKVKVQA
jgi:hypothetical protein